MIKFLLSEDKKRLIKKIFLRIFRKESDCYKCNSLCIGDLICIDCDNYIKLISEINRKKIIKDLSEKAEQKRRNWIKIRDDFLSNY